MAEKSESRFGALLGETSEVEEFLFALLKGLEFKELREGENVAAHAERLKLTVPAALRGEELLWVGEHTHDDHEAAGGKTLSFVRPGDPQAVGLTIGCVRTRWFDICLECGWIWCRIVIVFKF